MTGVTADEASDRALVLYALVRRATIELALVEFEHDPQRVGQAERARDETTRWLKRESLDAVPTEQERALLDAPSGSWPAPAITDAMWRKEAMGVLLWALGHADTLPGFAEEFEVPVMNQRIESYGSTSSFRTNGRLRPDDELHAAWLEADTWFAATEGAVGEDATLASISAERVRALAWLRDRDAAPA